MVISFLSTQISFAADSEWYWINSDDKYSKYFSTTRINTISSENNIPTCIEDWIKTGYAPGGAAETINNMKLPIKDPNQLSYSLARVQLILKTVHFVIWKKSFMIKMALLYIR